MTNERIPECPNIELGDHNFAGSCLTHLYYVRHWFYNSIDLGPSKQLVLGFCLFEPRSLRGVEREPSVSLPNWQIPHQELSDFYENLYENDIHYVEKPKQYSITWDSERFDMWEHTPEKAFQSSPFSCVQYNLRPEEDLPFQVIMVERPLVGIGFDKIEDLSDRAFALWYATQMIDTAGE